MEYSNETCRPSGRTFLVRPFLFRNRCKGKYIYITKGEISYGNLLKAILRSPRNAKCCPSAM